MNSISQTPPVSSQTCENSSRMLFSYWPETFNITDVDWYSLAIRNPNQYPLHVSQTFLDVVLDMHLEQLVEFSTREDNTLDLIFTRDSSNNIPPIGLCSELVVVLYHPSLRAVLQCQSIVRVTCGNMLTQQLFRLHFRTIAVLSGLMHSHLLITWFQDGSIKYFGVFSSI